MSASNEQRVVSAKSAQPELNDEIVREYLKEHDDFLQRNPDMLDYLHIAHASGSAVSLVEKQVSVLRERNMDMRHRLSALSANARDNDRLYEQSSKLVLQLLEAASVEELNAVLLGSLKKDLGVEYASLILYSEEAADTAWRTASRDEVGKTIGALFRGHKPVCGTLRREELNYLFAEAGGPGSAAIAPVAGDDTYGLVAVGSSDADRYNSGLDTMFLSHIANVIARLLPRLQSA